MSTASYNDIYTQFLAGGFGGKSEVLPTGTYKVKIAMVKGEQKQGKKFAVGVRLVVLDEGPHKDKSTWVNQTLTLPEPGKDATPFMMFLKFMSQLGAQAAIEQGVAPTELHKHIVVNSEGVAQLRGDRTWGNPPRAQQDLVSFTIEAVPSPLGGMVAVAGAGAPAQPAPVAPAPVAAPVAVPVIPQPAPIQQPAPVVQPAPVAVVPVAAPVVESAVPAPSTVPVAGPSVEELQAQLAALQAQQAAVVAPVVAAAPIPAGPSF